MENESPVTIELLPRCPEDVADAITAWLQPLRASAVTYRSGDPMPFTLVELLGGEEDTDQETADPLVMVSTLVLAIDGPVAAHRAARDTHLRMGYLARYLPTITLPDGRGAGLDYVTVVESTHPEDFDDDNILRHVATYQVGVGYIDSPTP